MQWKWKSAMEKLKCAVERSVHEVEVVDLVASIITQCEHLLQPQLPVLCTMLLAFAALFTLRNFAWS